MLLAKEIKIQTIRKQREFIRKQLLKVARSVDGDASYRYVGHVFPEVIKYFEEEGFVVTKVQSDLLLAMTKGVPVYVFAIDDLVKLSEEELQQAEAYDYEEQRAAKFRDEDDGDSFLEMIFGHQV